jgi:hypothetical protein
VRTIYAIALLLVVPFCLGARPAHAQTVVPERLAIGYDNEGNVDASERACRAYLEEVTQWDQREIERGARDVCVARKRHANARRANASKVLGVMTRDTQRSRVTNGTAFLPGIADREYLAQIQDYCERMEREAVAARAAAAGPANYP